MQSIWQGFEGLGKGSVIQVGIGQFKTNALSLQMAQTEQPWSTQLIYGVGEPWSIELFLIHCWTDEIHKEFPWFGILHRILSSRPNVIPPAIVTGVGPTGWEIVYSNPPPLSQVEWDSNIDPVLYTLHPAGISVPPPLPSQPSSQQHESVQSQQSRQSQSPTPVFAQPGTSSRSSSRPQSVTPALLTPSQREATPSSPRSRFASMMAKAKENVKIQPRKRSLEDTLSDGIL